MLEILHSGGYFTLLQYLLNEHAMVLEQRIGYKPGALSLGWRLLTPCFPLKSTDIDIHGSTRFMNGLRNDNRQIREIILQRVELAETQRRLARFFDRGLERRPAKVMPRQERSLIGYVPAEQGIPQFKLTRSIEWFVVADVAPSRVLTLEMLNI